MLPKSHLLPFLWLRGEDDEALWQGVAQIAASGCGALCAESRTHPDFLGPSWWHAMEVLVAACRAHHIGFYLLDDTHFPSGYANGAAKGTPWQRMMMTERHMDVRGPRRGGCISVRADGETDALVAVVAARRVESRLQEQFVDLGGWAVDSLTDLTAGVRDGLVRWDVPEGTWRVFVLSARFVTERNPPQAFVNPLLPQGGRLMLETVYEAHWAHMKDSFGDPFLGFFSDEPALRAGRGCKAVLGEYPQLPIPWRMDLPDLLSAQMGKPARALLPGLWYDIGPDTPRIRYALMDTVSRLYGEHYAQPIGDWCQAHGVAYVGHVIEQNGAHSRLGQGAGHYFRAMRGQDMAGMDYVLHELKPEFRDTTHAWKTQDFEAQDDFFRYMLPQMTVSCARLDAKKQGRALCEIFGAYGWQEDMAEMRYLAHLLLSRGVNHFTPHAYSLQPFPDPDSPPHFGAFNPLSPWIARLFHEMEVCGAALDGGEIPCGVGVLYHAEAEWACGKETMQTQAVVKVLNQNQIFCEIVPVDWLQPGRYQLLLIPHGRLWPLKLFERLRQLREAGCRVAFVDAFPQGLSEGEGSMEALLDGCETVPLAEAARLARSVCQMPVEPLGSYPQVSCLPYMKDDLPLLAVFNEDDREAVAFRFRAAGMTNLVAYDPEQGCCYRLEQAAGWTLPLQPGQLWLVGPHRSSWPQPREMPVRQPCGEAAPLWRIRCLDGDAAELTARAPFDLSALLPRYAGRVLCEAELTLPAGCTAVQVPASGAARMLLDGKERALAVAAPYLMPAESGAHTLGVEFTLPLFFRHHDELSFFNYISPVGVQGDITLLAAHAR